MTTETTAPPVLLADLLDLGELAAMIEQGYVRRQVHPDLPLAIYNYTEKAAYEREWNDVTRQCRGLIVNTATGAVVARPFGKFFNYGEDSSVVLDLDAPAEITDKLDGSLGILYQVPGGWAIATRGSFTSEQAAWATDWFSRYADRSFFGSGKTYLFEIIARWNRIVVEYTWEGLVLIGILDMETGRDIDLPEDPWLLQARPSRDDRGEHQGNLQGLEDLPGMQERSSATRQPEAQRAALCVPEGLAAEQPGEDGAVPAEAVSADQGCDRRIQARPSMHGLRADIPVVRNGLRSRPGVEEVQCRAGQEPDPTGRGDSEMRSRLRELPQDSNVRAFRITDRFPVRSLAAALTLPPRQNAEGVVVRMLDTGMRLKIKQSDYVALHRILTMTTARTVWEYLAVDACRHLITAPKHWGSRLGIDPARAAEILAVGPDWLGRLTEGVPDEFHGWLRTTISGLRTRASGTREALGVLMATLRAEHGSDRKAFAQAVAGHPHAGALFLLLDGRDITTYLWKSAYPPPEKAWGARSEDTA